MIKGNFIPINFLGLDENSSRFQTSKVVILPVPFERTVSFGRGTSRGPSSIIYSSRCLELYDDELGCEPYTCGVHTLAELECGSVDSAHMVSAVSEACSQLLGLNKFIITLGGEHSITLGAIKGHKTRFKDFSVLNLDAPWGLRDSYEGTPFNHACVMRRVLEEGYNVVEVGIRSYSKEEAEFIKGNKNLKVIHAREIFKSKNQEWMDEVISSLLPQVYISVDLDVFDPSFVSRSPATLDAFCSATLATLVGSSIPASTKSQYSNLAASKPNDPFPSFIFCTTTDPSQPALSAIILTGSSSALLTMLTPAFSSSSPISSASNIFIALIYVTPPPGTIPSSTAALVACKASSTNAFLFFISASVAAPTLITPTPPANFASLS